MTVDDKTVDIADVIGTVSTTTAADTIGASSTANITDAAKSFETKGEAVNTAEPQQKRKRGKPYDDVFRTLMVNCPELVIPLVNEVFGEQYDIHEKVSKYHEIFFENSSERRETDSHIGIRQKKYHVECQSTTDGTLMIRLFEYDTQIAIEDAVQKKGRVVFTFPYTAVLYLRCNKNTPSRMEVTIKVPGDSAKYDIPVMKVPEYTLEEIMEKELFFLLPFHLFRYEKKLKIYENDEERLEELKETYGQIMEYLDRKLDEERLTALQRWVIQETTKKVVENLAVKYEKVVEGVTEIMGGQVIELECVKQWNARLEEGRTLGVEEGRTLGIEEGRTLGKEDGLSALVKTLKSIFNDFNRVYDEIIKNEVYADVTREKVMEYYQ